MLRFYSSVIWIVEECQIMSSNHIKLLGVRKSLPIEMTGNDRHIPIKWTTTAKISAGKIDTTE